MKSVIDTSEKTAAVIKSRLSIKAVNKPVSTLSYDPTLFFFFNATATTQIYTLSLHDALPISNGKVAGSLRLNVFERRDDRSRHGADRAEHSGIIWVEKRLCGCAGDEWPQLVAGGHCQ